MATAQVKPWTEARPHRHNDAAPRPHTRVTATEFTQLMACWSTGVAVVTGTGHGKPVGCTVNAVTSVSLHPPLLLVSLAAASRTLAAICRQRRFGLNLLLAQRSDLAGRFATSDPATRFAGVDYRWAEGVPVLQDVVSAAVCDVERCVEVADHVLVVATPVWWLRASRRSPLVSYDRSYWSLWSMARVGG